MALITDPDDLPEPEDEFGYPAEQLWAIFDALQMRRFRIWMNQASADPRVEQETVFLECDVRAFVAGGCLPY